MKLDAETIHHRIAELLHSRRHFVVATIAEVKGSCPQKPGAKMIIHPDGSFEFTIGGGTFEAEVLEDARAVLGEEVPVHHEYRLTKPELGMYCQGLVRVMFESYHPLPRMVIFGGGHVGQALSKLAAASELFQTVVVDDRSQYADVTKHPVADQVILTDRSFLQGVPDLDENTYVVIVTRCHETDKILVRRTIDSPVAYLGLIGSKSKIRQFRHELEQEGVSPALLDRIHAPIGLPIGGKSPAEVAISILAEVIQIKNVNAAKRRAVDFQIKSRRATTRVAPTSDRNL